MSPRITDLDKLIRDVPAMPIVAQKVMDMLGDPRTTNTALGETLGSDQSLASRILQMANSPFFGVRQKIGSISGAIFVLGHSALRSVIITVCTKGLYQNPGLMEEKLWEHALGTAVASRAIAAETESMDPDEAFIAGLLHDIGRTSLAVVYPNASRLLFQRAYDEDLDAKSIIGMERAEFNFDHCQVGSRVLLAWRLPNVYARIARRHHVDSLELLRSESEPKAVATAGQANLIAARTGLGRKGPDRGVDVISTIYNEVLGLDRNRALKIVEQTLTTYGEARNQFSLS